MKIVSCLIFAAVIAGCCGCYNREIVVVERPVAVPYAVPPREVVVRETVRETRSRSLLGHVVVGTTLICADVVGLVFPIGDRTEVLRERFYSGGF